MKKERREHGIALAHAGLTRAEIARQVGVTPQAVSRWLSIAGVAGVNGHDLIAKPERNREIAQAYADGVPLRDLSSRYGISAQRISMIAKHQGYPLRGAGRKHGVRQSPHERLTRQQRRDRAILSSGVTSDQFTDPEEMRTAYRRFIEQRGRARDRGIRWSLTFPQWWALWDSSGLWAARGRARGDSAVMARLGDTGPYSVENVYITTLAKNFVDSHLVRGHRIKGEASAAAVANRLAPL